MVLDRMEEDAQIVAMPHCVPSGLATIVQRVRLPGLFILFVATSAVASDPTWSLLADGLELGRFKVNHSTPVGDSTITILRADPSQWELRLLSVGAKNKAGVTAKDVCERFDLVGATNAGMFHPDQITHVGYMRSQESVNCKTWNQYLSAASFGPKRNELPEFQIFDLDATSADSVTALYRSVVQNLRLIKKPGENRWAQQEKRWSEAALGEDNQGRILFIFCRSPYSMHDLNEILLSLPIGLVSAQHLEGGPEAQLYIRVGDSIVDAVGSYETGFNENDHNVRAWTVPNLIGLKRKPPTQQD